MSGSNHPEDPLEAGMIHHRAGRLAEAERHYRLACDSDPKNPRAFHLLGVVSHQLQRPDAVDIVGRAVLLDPGFAEAHNDRGVILAASGRFSEALSCFEQAIAINPGYGEARNNLGRALRSAGRLEEAVAQFEQLLKIAPNSAAAHFNLASAFESSGRYQDAERHCRSVIALHPGVPDGYMQLAGLLQKMDRMPEALARAEHAVALAPRHAGARNNLGNVLRAMYRHDEAIAQYRAALEIDPNLFITHYNFGMALRAETRIAEARAHFARAAALKPDFLEAELARCMAELPALYEDAAEIAAQRTAYASGLARLSEKLDQANAPATLVDAIGSHQPFYLPYQGHDDRKLQSLYGSMVCRILAARYPASKLPAPPAAGERVRLGIVSGFFRQHSNWKIPIKGWLTKLNRNRFEVCGYHTSVERDSETELAQALCQRFVQAPLSLEAWRCTILDDAPHVLLFPEIGMDKVTAQLAALRLAPVQCCSWGHPVTSGFPTIDYFLSSDLMEPSGAAAHYSEKLVRLPNLSIYYEPVDLSPDGVDRAELGLGRDAVVFWCAQSLPKYLPQFDEVLARIALEVPGCQFTFIKFAGGREVTGLFKARLERAFQAMGLDAKGHCVFLPRLAADRFSAAIGQCDIVLDSIGWSGCNSILESLAHDLPIVAFTGEMMRGRHAAAILDMMNVRETTARTIDEYVAIASSLGRDAAARAELSIRIAGNKHRVYRDLQCIAGLESFLEDAVRKPAV